MDTLLSLRVFAAVAEHKSFSDVANRMNLSPAMTSKHVQHIEARVGARLLNRNSRNVSLTEAGEQYLFTVRPLLEGLQEAENQLSQTARAPSGTLRVSMPVWMTNPHFAKTIAAFHAQYPKVLLDFDLSGKKINMVEEGVDLALRVTVALNDGLIARKLTHIHFPLVAAPAFLERFGRPKTMADLDGAPFLLYDQIAANGHIRYGEGDNALDVHAKPVLRSGNETLLHMSAREGMGFVFLPHWLCGDDLKTGVLERVLPDVITPQIPLYAVYPDRSYLPAKTRCFLDFLVGSQDLKFDI